MGALRLARWLVGQIGVARCAYAVVALGIVVHGYAALS